MDENRIQEFVEGLLAPEAAAEVEEHIAGCSECRAVLSAIGRAGATGVELFRASLVGEVLKETYRIEELIGRGGMGQVYRASHLRLNRQFAIKMLLPSAAEDEAAFTRFQREADITSKLAHPHIVEVMDFDRLPDGLPYLVMELLEGEDLEKRLRRSEEPLPLDQIGSILEQASSALQAAHEQGIVHRDLKPSNVFLCRRGSQDDFVKIMDFGISKIVGVPSHLTRNTQLIGSPAYMAPEQVEAELGEVDHRADVYAMGAILYRMLVGRPPFRNESVPQLLYEIVHREAARVRALRAELPVPVERAVARALRKRPEERTASMNDLWLEFSGQPEDPSAAGRSSTRSAPLGKIWKRRWSRAALPGVIALLLAGVVGTGLLFGLRRHGDHASGAARQAGIAADAGGPGPVASPLFDGKAGARDSERMARLTRSTPRDLGSSRPAGEQSPQAVASELVIVLPGATKGSQRNLTRRQQRHGTVFVQTSSALEGGYLWADVFLDGTRVGRTALTIKEVPAGAHTVEVRRDGYQSQRSTIHVRRGQRLPVRFKLSPRNP